MRQLSNIFANLFGRSDVPKLPPPQVSLSSVVSERMNRTLRRRLSDRVMDVFQESCIAGDLATAEELLAVMDGMHRRRQAAMGERRLSTEYLDSAREDLATRKGDRLAPPVLEPAD